MCVCVCVCVCVVCLFIYLFIYLCSNDIHFGYFLSRIESIQSVYQDQYRGDNDPAPVVGRPEAHRASRIGHFDSVIRSHFTVTHSQSIDCDSIAVNQLRESLPIRCDCLAVNSLRLPRSQFAATNSRSIDCIHSPRKSRSEFAARGHGPLTAKHLLRSQSSVTVECISFAVQGP